MAKYKSENYKGKKLNFIKRHSGMIFAQAPEITTQYIGIGKTKKQAFEDAKDSIDKIKPKVSGRFNAGEVLRQLGGNKFIAMTGAKNFVKDDINQMISFKIMRNAKGVSHVRITLNAMDTYDMEFLSIRAGKIKVKSKFDGAYNDMLQSVFTEHTGLYTYL